MAFYPRHMAPHFEGHTYSKGCNSALKGHNSSYTTTVPTQFEEHPKTVQHSPEIHLSSCFRLSPILGRGVALLSMYI